MPIEIVGYKIKVGDPNAFHDIVVTKLAESKKDLIYHFKDGILEEALGHADDYTKVGDILSAEIYSPNTLSGNPEKIFFDIEAVEDHATTSGKVVREFIVSPYSF